MSHEGVNEEEMCQLYCEANKGCLVMHLLWVLWSLVQAHLTGLTGFDYLEYARLRYTHYKELKKRMNGTLTIK